MPWYEYVRIGLFVLWIVVMLLTVKLLVTRQRWRHPLRGNGPMLYALLMVLAGVELARARNIEESPPPYTPSLLLSAAATALILYWLWRQMELMPRWIREHVPWRRTSADYTMKEHEGHMPSTSADPAREQLTEEERRRKERATESKSWPPRDVETK